MVSPPFRKILYETLLVACKILYGTCKQCDCSVVSGMFLLGVWHMRFLHLPTVCKETCTEVKWGYCMSLSPVYTTPLSISTQDLETGHISELESELRRLVNPDSNPEKGSHLPVSRS